MIERLLLLFNKYPLDFISGFGSSLPILIGLIRYKYLSKSLKFILLFFFMYFVGDTYGIWLGVIRQNNLFILNIYPIIGIVLLSIIYRNVIRGTTLKKFIVILGALLSITCLTFFKYESISTIELFIYKAYIILIVLLHFNGILSDLKFRNILLHSMFWISASLIIHAMGTFFTSLFNEFIFDATMVDDATFDIYWNISNVLFIIMIVLSSIGLWVSKYDSKNLV